MNYDAAIFDLDGTLLKSTAGHLEWMFAAVEAAVEETGEPVDIGELTHQEMKTLAGIEGYESFEQKSRELGFDDEDFRTLVSYHRARQKLQLLEEDLLHLVDGAGELLEELRREKIRTAVVSNAPDPSVDEVVRYFDLARELDFFRGVTDLEDFRRRKPDPFHIELAREELDAEKCVYIGDSEVDVEAAERLGVDSIHIGGKNSEATFTAETLEEVAEIFRD